MSRCPTPQKVAFEREGKALKALKKMPLHRARNLSTYKCKCGAWHHGRTTLTTVRALQRR